MRKPRRSRPSVRRWTTWSATPSRDRERALADLLDRLSPARQREALTHRSWSGPRRPSYERLEFLGDSVLQVEVTEELMRRHPAATEGQLTAMRQRVVSGPACARAARASGLGQRLERDAPERSRPGARQLAERESVLAALAEAAIGAGWTELGHEQTRPLVLAAFAPELDGAHPDQRDPKTALQEAVARHGGRVVYEHLDPEGPPHERVFTALVHVDGAERGRGSGPSKQAAERAAAETALTSLGVV